MSEKNNNLFPKQMEEKETPAIKYRVIRHEERTNTGELTADGIKNAQRQGQNLKVTAEITKGYASKEKSDRAYKTVDTISAASGLKSPLTEKAYETRRRPGLFYDLSGPLMPRIDGYSKSINEAVKRDYPDFDPQSSDPKWGKIRKEYQPIGVKKMIVDDQELSHIFSMGAAHELVDLMKIGERYSDYRENKAQVDEGKSLEKDLVMMEGTHGGFLESLLKKTMIRVNNQGQEKIGFDTFTDAKGNPEMEAALGGIFKPGESFDVIEKIGQEKTSRLPIEFENPERLAGEKCFLDLDRVKILADQFNAYYEKFQAWQKDKSQEGELLSCLEELKVDWAKKYEGGK